MGIYDSNGKTIKRPRRPAGLRGARDKTLSPHGHTARFLYLMLAQFNIKQVNWQKVADGTGIPSGRSAQARYGRFKRQIESQILGDAIQIKREQQESNQTNQDGIIGDAQRKFDATKYDLTSDLLMRTYAPEEFNSGALYADHNSNVKQKVKLEANDTTNVAAGVRSRTVSPGIITIDDEDDNNNLRTIVKSEHVDPWQSVRAFIKKEQAQDNDDSTSRLPANLNPSTYSGNWFDSQEAINMRNNNKNNAKGATNSTSGSNTEPWRSTVSLASPGIPSSQNALSTFGTPQWTSALSANTTNTSMNTAATTQLGSNTAQNPVFLD